MASGTSQNGSHSPGNNMTSEHAIDIILEPIKQDLPEEETQKLNHNSSTNTTLRLIPASVASGASKLSCFFLAYMPFQRRTPSPRLPISSAVPVRLIVSNNQNSPMPFQDLEGGVPITNYKDLPDYVDIYSTNINQLLDIVQGLKGSVKAMLEGGSLKSCRDTLAASMASLEQVGNHLNTLKSDADGLDAELRAIESCKDIYNVIFTLFAAVCGSGVVIAAKVDRMDVAMAVGGVAAASSVVFLAVGKRMDTRKDKLKIPVQKRKDIAEVIDGACKLAVGHVHYLKSQTESILKMVDSGSGADMESNDIVAGLKQGFQELESEIERCSKDVDSARQAVVQTITKCYPTSY